MPNLKPKSKIFKGLIGGPEGFAWQNPASVPFKGAVFGLGFLV